MILAEQLFLPTSHPWIEIRDGNLTALSIYDRHYSSERAHVREIDQFVGPGSSIVLITPCARALFVWRKFISDAGQAGVNCAVFRNEGAGLSSDLILAAESLAGAKWPGQRLYTYCNPRRIRSTNPGYCFIKAGWKPCGYSVARRLRILEKLPS